MAASEACAALGARRGEVLALRWSDILDGRATIARSLAQTKQVLEFKGTKSERPRVVKIPESALATLQLHRKRQDEFRRRFGPDYRSDFDLIFANPDGTRLKPDSVSAAVSLLFRRLKLPKGASLHSLRHTHTSHLLASGVPLTVVSSRLGHSSPRAGSRITHVVSVDGVSREETLALSGWPVVTGPAHSPSRASSQAISGPRSA